VKDDEFDKETIKPSMTSCLGVGDGEGEQEARSTCCGQTSSHEEVVQLAYYSCVDELANSFTWLPLAIGSNVQTLVEKISSTFVPRDVTVLYRISMSGTEPDRHQIVV